MNNMKRLYVLLFAVVLIGCVSAPTFDPIEYNQIVEMAHEVRLSSQFCGATPMAALMTSNMLNRIKYQAGHLDVYVTYRPDRKELKEIVTIINKDLEEMQKKYSDIDNPPSIAYCTGKLKILDSSLTRILNTVGGLPQQ